MDTSYHKSKKLARVESSHSIRIQLTRDGFLDRMDTQLNRNVLCSVV
jgi:hypothetical protein